MMDRNMENQLSTWAHEAGEMATSAFRQTGDLVFKSGQEAVTEADRRIETHLRSRIAAAFPADLVVGEEFGGPSPAEVKPTDRVWHLDPIDGTLNFALGLPAFCTSLAVMQGDDVLAACVHQPLVGDTFTALKSGGARLNGEPMQVSARGRMDEAVVSAQFKKDGLLVSHPEVLQALFRETLKVRKIGAIALEMAWTAAGFYDGLLAGFRGPIQLYDVAAGLLLLTEAGGRLSDFQGQPYRLHGTTMLATNGLVHDELVALLNRPV
jgi:myo-inositol-1(or 4)-monophosphatase